LRRAARCSAPLQHHTYTEEDRAPAHRFAPFAPTGAGGPGEVLSEDDPRKLVTTLGVRTKSDLVRARRVQEARDLNRKVGAAELNTADSEDPLAGDGLKFKVTTLPSPRVCGVWCVL
jgi:hypothetical protein